MATEDNKKSDGVKLTQADIYAMRTEFFNKVKDADMRRRILTIAFAYGDDTKMPHATDMMAWYLAQPENRDKIDQLALEYIGYTPDEAEALGEGDDSKDRPKGTRRTNGGGKGKGSGRGK